MTAAPNGSPHPDPPPPTGEGSEHRERVGALLKVGIADLVKAGIEQPNREARLLLNLALGESTSALLSSDMLVGIDAANRFQVFVDRRASHEPYSRIAGKREFWSHEFLLSPDTLDPRPDSETLIEAALALIPDRSAPLDLLDFGTGTGALLLALLAELPNASGTGIDLAVGAVATARRNAAALGLDRRARFRVGNWGEGLAGQWDVILANPPYIPSEQIPRLAPDVARYDPALALDGGADGLRSYRELAPDLARLLRPAGLAVCEIGEGQGQAVARIMAGSGLVLAAARNDLAGIERCLLFRIAEN